jgi:sugar porter (SP) family MFS transporter
MRARTTEFNRRYLLFIAGLGGLLYGIDVGIISGALPYLEATASLTWQLSAQQLSLIVAAVLLGSVLSSLLAGSLSDWFGRRAMMIVAGVLFSASIPIIALAAGYWPLMTGRLLQGISGGLIGVVVPLYLAESLGADQRGRGTALFQLLLTLGIVFAALIGLYYAQRVDAVTVATQPLADVKAQQALLFAVRDEAWRNIFWISLLPGIVFTLGAFALHESPRWLVVRGQERAALNALLATRDPVVANAEWAAMTTRQAATRSSSANDTLWQRRYLLPFALACIILACNQATGINSVLAYIVNILQHAGLLGALANSADVSVKIINALMTVVGVMLVDRKGRKFLLMIGTGGIVLSLLGAALLFLLLPLPSPLRGWSMAICLASFIGFFAVGPGVCVWLALSELMPTRIRSNGMSIALLLNQFVSTGIAAVFLPVVGQYGYAAMFLFWAACTTMYFVLVTFWLPETKGQSLEQIEAHFAGKS